MIPRIEDVNLSESLCPIHIGSFKALSDREFTRDINPFLLNKLFTSNAVYTVKGFANFCYRNNMEEIVRIKNNLLS